MMNDFEPVFQPQIPERLKSAFSRQWYAAGGWKLEEPSLMMKVDRTKQKLAELLRRITVLGSDNVIPEWLYSSLYDYIRWVMVSTGVYKISMDGVRDSSSGFHAIRYVDKTEKIYPKISHPTKEDWDGVVFGDRIRIGDNRKGAEYCAVMPSMETVEWLNQINSYCIGMDDGQRERIFKLEKNLRKVSSF